MENDKDLPNRYVVIGNGNQGFKHVSALGSSCVCVVDEINSEKGIAALNLVPIDTYDAIAICTPENVKRIYVDFGIQNKKYVLVEKPFEIQESDLVRFIELIDGGLGIQTAYDHMFDQGVVKFISRAQQIFATNPSWSSMRFNYSFGTEELIKNSLWMDFGTGPWELVAPHLLRIFLEIKPDCEIDFEYAFGFSKMESPSTVVATLSGSDFVQFVTSYTSWKNEFQLELIWDEGSLKLDGVTKWGESTLVEHQRSMPAGAPVEVDRITFPPRTPTQAVATMYLNAFKGDWKSALYADSKISLALRLARSSLLQRNKTSEPEIWTS